MALTLSPKFEEALHRFIAKANELVFDGTEGRQRLSYTIGQKRIRIEMCEADSYGTGRSVWAFVEANGDIMKPATWSRPAKHARGNIFNKNPIEGFAWTGPYYLK